MIKQATVFAILIALTLLSPARTSAAGILLPNNPEDSVVTGIPLPDQMLEEIINAIGTTTVFNLKEAPVLNLQASLSHRKKMILYNPLYIDWLNRSTRDKWAVMTLLAHEVGHHLNGHTKRKKGSSPKVELEADEFAGAVLYKLGATLEESQKVMNYIAQLNGSDTHPGRMARKQAIQTGWVKASNEKH